ncbi:hypothetical protein GUJ93_ZPchr0014g47273 [Zizania palustris]|uniref:Glycosyltransferase n=1 Tax=Zizania palustris TaxID=103762 RepID=A0A8J5W5V1_ZIZPA|nr:hypothetical protein GUJ93_ZPchr0014g47273 [Zizania palustris]
MPKPADKEKNLAAIQQRAVAFAATTIETSNVGMGAEAIHHQPVVFLVPFPAQGHVTPMLHLARALAAHGVAATVAVPDFIHRRIVVSSSSSSAAGGGRAAAGGAEYGDVELASIPSGILLPEEHAAADPPGFAAIVHAMEHHMPAQLERMLLTTSSSSVRGGRVACLVVDVLASWAVPVAERWGVPAVGFWPAMLASYRAVAAIPELISKGIISDDSGAPVPSNQHGSDDGQEQVIRGLGILPAHLQLSTNELPWFVGDSATQKSRFAFWLQTLQRARGFRSVLVNSFPGEAGSAAAYADDDEGQLPGQGLRVLPVGPFVAGSNVVERAKGDGGFVVTASNDPQQQQLPCSKNPSMWQADSTCIGWLDAQPAASVVYVSFGSWVGPIGHEKIQELALGLEATGRPFLWALKKLPSWRAGLPGGYAERVAGRGKLVEWAPQEDVLRHDAIGCYLTHCGWNSTVEAIHHGVRMLCYPVSGDQFINCAYITRVWEIGLKLSSASRDGVRDCIEKIMDGAEGTHLQAQMNTLRRSIVTGEARRLAHENVKSFVNEIKRSKLPVIDADLQYFVGSL